MAVQTNANKLDKTKSNGKFFKYVKAELKKVIWPTKKELTSYTSVVIATSVIASVAIWAADTVFGKALQLIVK